MYVLRRRWKDPQWKCPHKEVALVNPLQRFWKQLLHILFFATTICLFALVLLIVIPSRTKPIKYKVKAQRGNEYPDIRNILKFGNMAYFRGNWIDDKKFVYGERCHSDLQTYDAATDTETMYCSKDSIRYFGPPEDCLTAVFALGGSGTVASWEMGNEEDTSFWAERTIFGRLDTGGNEGKMFRSSYPILSGKKDSIMAATGSDVGAFHLITLDPGASNMRPVEPPKAARYCGVQDANTENYLSYGQGYGSQHPIFVNEDNFCLYVCYDMVNCSFAKENLFSSFNPKLTGGYIQKANDVISRLSIHIYDFTKGASFMPQKINRWPLKIRLIPRFDNILQILKDIFTTP